MKQTTNQMKTVKFNHPVYRTIMAGTAEDAQEEFFGKYDEKVDDLILEALEQAKQETEEYPIICWSGDTILIIKGDNQNPHTLNRVPVDFLNPETEEWFHLTKAYYNMLITSGPESVEK